jgi:small-conductance mechanosensitive channel
LELEAEILDSAGGLRGTEQLTEAAGETPHLLSFSEKFGITLAVIAGQALFIWFVWFIFKKISKKVKAGAGSRIKPITIKNLKILTPKQIVEIILFVLRVAKYLITVFQLIITVPIVFSLYPATEQLAFTIFGYFINPIKKILMDAVNHIPNIITIIIILLIVKYIIRGLRSFANQIAKGKLVVPGFYADWAWPTFNILRVLLYAFTLAVIYPYLPGSESRVFQGVSVFVGVIFSLGSSSAISNLMAGLVITYMRPFKIGDRIKIKDLTGFVVEKSPFVVRIRTIKNEFITFPNSAVLNSDIVNYNTSGEEEGLVLHAKVTMGYDVPWRDVYDILVKAAEKTPHVEENPKPFVLQTSLDDFCASYEINVYTKEIEKVLLIYSLLYQNIQDGFKNAGISLFIPHQISVSSRECRRSPAGS